MKISYFYKTGILVIFLALFTFLIYLIGILSFIFAMSKQEQSWNVPMSSISRSLTQKDGEYLFTGQDLLAEKKLWAMLISEQGQVIWAYQKPESVPQTYTLTDVASFTRWYLDDYPVQTHIRSDGLLVVGAPRGSTWKYLIISSENTLTQLPYWLAGIFFLYLCGVVIFSTLILRRWFRKEQQVRDTARADWIHGISHDVRTPLSMLMGYAANLEQDETLSPKHRKQAKIMLRQSDLIKELINDLNLTMRLDYEMQPLRKKDVSPAALVRQVAADFLNGGLEEPYTLSVEIPQNISCIIQADEFLIRRALINLINNCIRHNPNGCQILVGLRTEQKECAIWVCNNAKNTEEACLPAKKTDALAEDGGAAHGTGLKLVEQIVKVHGGRVILERTDNRFLCEFYLPIEA